MLNRNCEKVLLKQKSIQEAALEEKSAHYFGWGRLRGMLRCSIQGEPGEKRLTHKSIGRL